MTQEQKDLLFKDLCARLPYNPMVEYKGKTYNVLGVTHERLILCKPFMSYTCDELPLVEEVKPYLFPLSSMTVEQLKEIQEIIGNPNEACISVNTLGLELWLNPVGTDPSIWIDSVFEIQDWLNAHHFDFRGLIEKSLALDATNLNIY